MINIYAPLHLKKEPFSTSPDPSFFYHSPDHRKAKVRLEINIRTGRGLSVLLGDVGTGKTTLWRSLLASFQGETSYIFHVILDPYFSNEVEFLIYLAKLFNVSPVEPSLVSAKEAIVQYLYKKTVSEQKKVVLIIDEGQKLSAAQIEILRVLLNYETNEFKMLQLVILAQLELIPVIQGMPNFVDRIADTCRLEPLDEYETGEMIRFRLAQAGYSADEELFSEAAIKRIYHNTRGYPRKIARVCHKIMESVIMDRHDYVTDSLVTTIIARDKIWGNDD